MKINYLNNYNGRFKDVTKKQERTREDIINDVSSIAKKEQYKRNVISLFDEIRKNEHPTFNEIRGFSAEQLFLRSYLLNDLTSMFIKHRDGHFGNKVRGEFYGYSGKPIPPEAIKLYNSINYFCLNLPSTNTYKTYFKDTIGADSAFGFPIGLQCTPNETNFMVNLKRGDDHAELIIIYDTECSESKVWHACLNFIQDYNGLYSRSYLGGPDKNAKNLSPEEFFNPDRWPKALTQSSSTRSLLNDIAAICKENNYSLDDLFKNQDDTFALKLSVPPVVKPILQEDLEKYKKYLLQKYGFPFEIKLLFRNYKRNPNGGLSTVQDAVLFASA